MTLKNKITVILFSAILILSNKSYANENILKDIEKYLNAIKTIEADFTQTTSYSKGQMSGKFFLKRPGRLKFEYNEIEDFIVADGSMIHFYDSQMQQNSSTSIRNTPAYFFLTDVIKLSGELTPTEISDKDNLIKIEIKKEEQDLSGTLAVFFNKNPIQLMGWRITDALNNQTYIVLQNAKFDQNLDNNMFYFYHPKATKTLHNK